MSFCREMSGRAEESFCKKIRFFHRTGGCGSATFLHVTQFKDNIISGHKPYVYIFIYKYLFFIGKATKRNQLLQCCLHFALLLWHPNQKAKNQPYVSTNHGPPLTCVFWYCIVGWMPQQKSNVQKEAEVKITIFCESEVYV